ncbi:PIG-L family deacetylase [Streptomyces sp. NPDC051018]|uniref:PIG-L deacetylase family protein n=1 Tax=Streptomyces sp. NPDC051018 TaxID=3365639 RepID=UPI0037B9917D
MNRLLLAPHPDDAVWSCGGMLTRWCAEGELTVVTVFDGDTAHSGDADTARRRAEDAAALGRWPLRSVTLGLPEAALRHDAEGRPLYAGPLALRRAPHPLDATLIGRLAALLRPLTAGRDEILLPLAVRTHVDHQLVRSATEAALTAGGAGARARATGPGVTRPGAGGHAAAEPGAEGPGPAGARTTEPRVGQPIAAGPGAAGTHTAEPGATRPGATRPAAVGAGATRPGVTGVGTTGARAAQTGAEGPRVRYYAEFPYAPPSPGGGYREHFEGAEFGDWLRGALVYESQVRGMFGGAAAFARALARRTGPPRRCTWNYWTQAAT